MCKERIFKRIKLAEETKAPFGVGAFIEGNILLVGEQASDPTTAPEQQLFCDTKGCSGWLNNLLEAAEIPEERLFWVNALNNDSTKVYLDRLIVELRPSVVIALGKVAKKACRESKLCALEFYHPQYWKRFKNKTRYDLIHKLKELTNV